MTEEAVPQADVARTYVRNGVVVIVLVLLAVAVFVVFGSAIEAIRTWFQPRWVPVARIVFAGGVAALAVWVLIRLTRR